MRIFGERVAFHRAERLLYSSDLASLPKMVTSRIQTFPDAVVLPNAPEELSDLLRLAHRSGIPLVPRGAGTAGYGGAVPAKGGIVVDMSGLNRIVDIDAAGRTVVVEPGVVWNDLEQALRRQGMALRTYPGSALSATVGGWIANGGGVGIGGFEYGYLKDNLVEMELITPKGTSTITSDALDLVEGMAGTSGFITQITLRLREGTVDVPVAAAFPSIDDLAHAFRLVQEEKIPLWEVGYKDDLNVRLTEQAVEAQAKKGPITHDIHGPHFPAGRLIATFVFPHDRADRVETRLRSIVASAGGEVLDNDLAQHEWAERFYGMRLKAAGPSLVPCEVVVPTAKLAQFVREVKARVTDLAFNGTLVNGGAETAFLGYRLDDERRQGFALAFVNSLIPLKLAQELGGRPYAAGMLLAHEAASIFGKERLKKAFELKRNVDPDGIMNPGKAFPASLDKSSPTKTLSRLTRLAAGQTGIIKAIDGWFGGKAPEPSTNGNSRLAQMPFGKEAVWDAFACANCGYCRNTCTQFKAIGWESASPRGKFHFLREYIRGGIDFDERVAEMFFTCTTCRRCNDVCQVRASIDEHWSLTMRPFVWQSGFNPPGVHQGNAHNIMLSHNPGAISQDERKAWMTPDLKYRQEGEIGYFAGCSASFSGSTRNLAVNAMRILNKGGIEPVYLGAEEWCCGGSMFVVGCLDEVMETVRHNIDELRRRGVKTLVTSCSGCWLHLAHFYPVLAKRSGLDFPIAVRHVTQVASEMIDAGRLKCKFPVDLRVTYHDPCHIGRGGGIFEEPRKILSAIPGLEVIEMERNKEGAACCGRHVLRYPRLGMAIHNDRLSEAQRTGAAALIGACPTCETNFRLGITEARTDLEVFDITDLLCQSVGLPTLVMSRFMKLGVM